MRDTQILGLSCTSLISIDRVLILPFRVSRDNCRSTTAGQKSLNSLTWDFKAAAISLGAPFLSPSAVQISVSVAEFRNRAPPISVR